MLVFNCPLDMMPVRWAAFGDSFHSFQVDFLLAAVGVNNQSGERDGLHRSGLGLVSLSAAIYRFQFQLVLPSRVICTATTAHFVSELVRNLSETASEHLTGEIVDEWVENEVDLEDDVEDEGAVEGLVVSGEEPVVLVQKSRSHTHYELQTHDEQNEADSVGELSSPRSH